MKKSISFVIALTFVMSLIVPLSVVSAAEIVKNGVLYYIDESEDPPCCYAESPDTKPTGDITILSKVTIAGKQYPVKGISYYGFSDCGDITGVTVQAGVEKIDAYAFNNCGKLASVTLNEGLTVIKYCAFMRCSALTGIALPSTLEKIGSEVFTHTSISTVTIPASVNEIDHNAFWTCESLKSINVAAGNVNYKSVDGVLFTADGKMIVTYPAAKTGDTYSIPSGVTEINSGAFSFNKYLQSVSLPSSVTYIGQSAFESCTALLTAVIPANVTMTGMYLFRGCTSLTEIKAAWKSPIFYTADGVLFSKDRTELISYPAGKTDVKYTVPSTVKQIDHEAFYENEHIEQVVFKSGLEYIGSWAFSCCTNLKAPTLPSTLKGIGGSAFNNTSVTYEIYDGVRYLGTSSNKHYACIEWLESRQEYTLHKDTKLIAGDAFSYSYNIKKIVMPEGLKYINTYAFDWDHQLSDVNIPSTVVQLGGYAFYGTGIKSLTVPGSVVSIDNSCFEHCGELESAVIGNGVETIGSSAFMYCFNLKTVTIPASVTLIESYAFFSDDELETVYYGGSEAQWKALTKNMDYTNEPLLKAKVIFGTASMLGDVNGDGVINNKDVVLLFKHLSGGDDEGIILSACDFNGDGSVNNKDVTALFKATCS